MHSKSFIFSLLVNQITLHHLDLLSSFYFLSQSREGFKIWDIIAGKFTELYHEKEFIYPLLSLIQMEIKLNHLQKLHSFTSKVIMIASYSNDLSFHLVFSCPLQLLIVAEVEFFKLVTF